MQPQPCYETSGLPSKSNLSNIGVPKTERSSIDASVRTSSSEEEDHSGELSISNASDMETEWVEQDEPGVYITIRALPGGTRELRRVRFRFVEIVRMENKLLFKETSVSFKIQNFICISFYAAERSLEKCMRDCGGKRTVPGYKSNICDYSNEPLHT